MHSDGLYITSCTLYCTHSISTVTADFFQSTSTVQSHVHSHCVITHTKDSPQSASTTSRPTATSFLSFSIHFSPLLFKTTFSANMMEYVIEYYIIRCDTPAMHTNHWMWRYGAFVSMSLSSQRFHSVEVYKQKVDSPGFNSHRDHISLMVFLYQLQSRNCKIPHCGRNKGRKLLLLLNYASERQRINK